MRYLLFALALIGTISVATATYADPGNDDLVSLVSPRDAAIVATEENRPVD